MPVNDAGARRRVRRFTPPGAAPLIGLIVKTPPLVLSLTLILAAWCASARGEPDARRAALLAASLDHVERLWDERAGLLWTSLTDPARRHDIRGSSQYAVGLMQRDGPGDRARALRVLDRVLGQQIRDPGQPWDGTFFRSAEELQPTQFSERWVHYDPNWRHFIGTDLAVLLLEYPDRLSPALTARLEDAIRRAVEGELQEKRLLPSYTNIALLHGFLWTFAGQRLHRPEWVRAGEAWAESVHAGFRRHAAFEEYNSPTYYGVDFYGLALWRKYGPTDRLRQLGAAMEAELWRDTARFYHAGLRNLCGPFDRAYGMDMRRYVALTGVWLALALDPPLVPLPDPRGPMEHEHDFGFGMLAAQVGAQLPEDALVHFRRFQGERLVERTLPGGRVATAWLGDRLMLGGEVTGLALAAGPASRTIFHPATVHWARPDGDIGWILLREAPRVDARATKGTLTVTAIGNSTWQIFAPGLKAADVTRDRWVLPGLTVMVETDALGFAVTPREDGCDVQYREATRMVLRTALTR